MIQPIPWSVLESDYSRRLRNAQKALEDAEDIRSIGEAQGRCKALRELMIGPPQPKEPT